MRLNFGVNFGSSEVFFPTEKFLDDLTVKNRD